MKTYLVTGTAGFIGSNLAEQLLKDGHEVIGLDIMSTGTQENLDILKKYSNFEFVFSDITDSSRMKELGVKLKEKSVNCIFHVAGLARIQMGIQNPEKCLSLNVLGTMNVLEMMKVAGIKNIVFSSSSSIYGLKHTDRLPLKEDYEPDCLNQYAWSKYASEQLIKTYCKLYRLDGICLRYFNVVGKREVLDGDLAPILGLFFRKLLVEKKPLTIIGDGLQRRDMTYIDDVVSANIKAATQCEKGIVSRFHGEVFNVGTGVNRTVLDLANSVLDSLGMDKQSNIIFVEPRPGEARASQADISKAKKFLGWEPKVILEDIICKHRDYYLDKWNIK